MHVEGLARLPFLRRELDGLHSREEIRERDPGFEAGERRADAEVHAVAEREVGVSEKKLIGQR